MLNLILTQQVISSSGETNNIISGTLSWTLGEIVTETGFRTEGESILTQGFQQGNLTATAIKEAANNGFTISVLPNPTSDYINLVTENFKGLDYQIFDINSKLMAREKLLGSTTKINLTAYQPGSYILRISHLNQELKSYQIIKN